MTGVEGLSTSSTVSGSSLGVSGLFWTHWVRRRCLAFGLAPKAAEDRGDERFAGRVGFAFSPGLSSSMGTSSKFSISSSSTAPTTAATLHVETETDWMVVNWQIVGSNEA